jgi:hypothetical protein
MDATELRQAIPAAIDALGGDSGVSSALGPDAWAIFRGGVLGYVALITPEDGEGDSIVHVTFPILRIPEQDAGALLKRLLELNHELGAFASF